MNHSGWFQVPPYTSGLHMPPSGVFLFSFTMRKLLPLLFLFCTVLTERCIAEESWGAALFKTKQHDFGRVALGADAEFSFEFTNIYSSDVRVLNVRSSCSCTSATFSPPILKPGETGVVIARFNTTGQHLRDKSAALTVQLETVASGARHIDPVQLFVSGYIRPDVLLTPGSIEFGAVSEGTAAERTLQLEYTGRPGWALMKVERSQPFIYAKAEEIRRERGDVAYRITVTLKNDAPLGYIKDVLRFTTNEAQPNRMEPVEILVPVQGVVATSIRAKPSPMLIGALAPGDSAAKNMIIRSETPFRITNVSAADARFRFAFSDQESAVQIVSVSFSAKQIAPGQPQNISEVIRISTNDTRHKTIIVDAFVRIVE